MIVDRVLYRDGRRVSQPASIEGTADARRGGDGVAWVALCRPSEEELAAVAHEFNLHERWVEEASHSHQRPKLECLESSMFCVLRAARYVDESETVEFSELQVFAVPGAVVTIRHGQVPDLPDLRRRLETRPEVVREGSVGILDTIIEQVVDDYGPVLAGVERDIDEIEDEVFGGRTEVSRRVYELSREVIAFQRATRPLIPMLERLALESGADGHGRMRLDALQDLALRIVEQADGFRQLLQNILNVNLTLETKALNEASNRQNEQIKMSSGWAAILFAPTVVGTAYGMNFEAVPELRWRYGFAYALLLMAATSATLYLLFKRRNWI